MHKIEVNDINELSYGQKYLLDLMDERKLAEFCRLYMPDKFTFAFNLAVNKLNFPPAYLIYDLRNVINPKLWFYHLDEKKPDNRVFNDDLEPYDIKKSINFKKIEKMFSNKELIKFTKDRNLNYSSFSHLIKGLRKFSPAFMYKIRDLFNPIDWFIYDEN